MMLRAALVFVPVFSVEYVFAQQTSTNVVPKEIFGAAIYRGVNSPSLPPVGAKKTMFVVYQPITRQSSVHISPVPKAQEVPDKADEQAKPQPKK